MSMMDSFRPDPPTDDDRPGAETGQENGIMDRDHEPDVYEGDSAEVPTSEQELEVPEEEPPFRRPVPGGGVDPATLDDGGSPS